MGEQHFSPHTLSMDTWRRTSEHTCSPMCFVFGMVQRGWCNLNNATPCKSLNSIRGLQRVLPISSPIKKKDS